MSALSRRKGRGGEREAELVLRDAGLAVERTLTGRHQGCGDLVGEGFAVEVRRRDRLSLVAWHRAHEELTPPHLTPVVVWRPDREPWRASMLLGDWADLVREARA